MTSRSERDAKSPAAQAAGFSMVAPDRARCLSTKFPAGAATRPWHLAVRSLCWSIGSVPKTGNHFLVRCSQNERGASRPLSNSPHEGSGQSPAPSSTPTHRGGYPLQTSPFRLRRILSRPLVGAAGSSLSDFGSCSSHSGVKDFAVPPIFSRSPRASPASTAGARNTGASAGRLSDLSAKPSLPRNVWLRRRCICTAATTRTAT